MQALPSAYWRVGGGRESGGGAGPGGGVRSCARFQEDSNGDRERHMEITPHSKGMNGHFLYVDPTCQTM